MPCSGTARDGAVVFNAEAQRKRRRRMFWVFLAAGACSGWGRIHDASAGRTGRGPVPTSEMARFRWSKNQQLSASFASLRLCVKKCRAWRGAGRGCFRCGESRSLGVCAARHSRPPPRLQNSRERKQRAGHAASPGAGRRGGFDRITGFAGLTGLFWVAMLRTARVGRALRASRRSSRRNRPTRRNRQSRTAR